MRSEYGTAISMRQAVCATSACARLVAHLDSLLKLGDHVLFVQALLSKVAHPLVHRLVAAWRAYLLPAVIIVVSFVVPFGTKWWW